MKLKKKKHQSEQWELLEELVCLSGEYPLDTAPILQKVSRSEFIATLDAIEIAVQQGLQPQTEDFEHLYNYFGLSPFNWWPVESSLERFSILSLIKRLRSF